MISIVLTIHNKDFLVSRVINQIITLTKNRFELIIVLDGCNDNSENIVKETLSSLNFKDYKIFYTDDVFETKANNVGLKNSSSEYCILIQDDMVLNEYSWDDRLLKPMLKFSDVFAVSARASHNNIWTGVNDKWEQRLVNGKELIDYTDIAERNKGLSRDVFAIRDSCNRGPLLFNHEKLKSLDYLDESFAPYTWDDHDICYRAFNKSGWLSGVYWVDYISDLRWGTTRNKNAHIFMKAHHKNADLIFERHFKYLTCDKHNENRILI